MLLVSIVQEFCVGSLFCVVGVCVLCLVRTVELVGLQPVIVAFSGHTRVLKLVTKWLGIIVVAL